MTYKLAKQYNVNKELRKNGLIGKLADVEIPFFYYCNEKERKKGQFLFKCCPGCKHNPFPEQLKRINNPNK